MNSRQSRFIVVKWIFFFFNSKPIDGTLNQRTNYITTTGYDFSSYLFDI